MKGGASVSQPLGSPQVSNEAHVATNFRLFSFFFKKKKSPLITTCLTFKAKIPTLGLLTCAQYSAGLRGQTRLLEVQQTSWMEPLYLFNWTPG